MGLEKKMKSMDDDTPQTMVKGIKAKNESSLFVHSQLLWYAFWGTLYLGIPTFTWLVFPTVFYICTAVVVFCLAKFAYVNFRLDAKPTVLEKGPYTKKRVVVVGAGASGLVAVKELVAEGHEVDCFESHDNLGGVFYLQPERGGVWNNAHLTSSPYVTSYSDFPPLEVNHTHWHHAEYIDYLKAYARKFNILKHVTFKTTVQSIKKVAEGEWEVVATTPKGEMKKTYEHVVIATGLNQEPLIPDFPNRDAFKGKISHSAYFKSAQEFKGKDVLIVGIGETGADLVREVSKVANKTYHSIRRGTFVIPRLNAHTQLNNDYDTNRLRYSTPIWMRNALIWTRENFAYYTGGMDKAGRIRHELYQRSGAGAMSQFACKSNRFVHALANGSATLKDEIQQLTTDGAVFKDGSSVKCDAILLCTGFKGKVFCLSLPDNEPVPCMSRMFKKTFIPKYGSEIAFFGFARPSIGAVPPIAEMQARWMALLLSGKRKLPSLGEMREMVEFDRVNHDFTRDGNRPTLVNWIQFMDQVADQIGCRVDPKQMFSDPSLMWKVMTGPFQSAQYRLSGPGAKPHIAKASINTLPRGMPLVDLAFWTLGNCATAVLRELGMPGLTQFSTIL